MLRITQPVYENKLVCLTPKQRLVLLHQAAYQKNLFSGEASHRQFYLDFLTHPSPRSMFSFQGQLLFFIVYLVSYSQTQFSADLKCHLVQPLIPASPKFCLVSMTQPDLLLLSILNLAKNDING